MNYQYTIKLFSDAQPGTGLGGEAVNDFIPRDTWDRPVIPASHIKGLMRESVIQMFHRLNLETMHIGTVFGSRFVNDPFEGESRFFVSDAVSDSKETEQAPSIFVSRTSLDSSGVAKEGSLRTNEAIPVGTVFHGTISVNDPENSATDLMVRLGLLSVTALGGSRNRGCGKCLISFENQSNEIANLVEKLSEQLKTNPFLKSQNTKSAVDFADELNSEPVPVRLTFRASTPVCVPATAWVAKNNVVSSGFSIPASAVRGMLIRQFRNQGDKAMEALYNCKDFVAGPLQPCGNNGKLKDEQLPIPIRVSLTHKAAKFSVTEYTENDFEDASIPGYIIEEVPNKAPMKASDGVLLVSPDGIRLWKASDMPHIIQMHGVHRNAKGENERNLYTVDSMAELVWRGLAVIPMAIAKKLIENSGSEMSAAFGTRRSVQGQGTLKVEIISDIPTEWKANPDWEKTVLVVQSPISIPEGVYKADAANDCSIEEQFRQMVITWLKNHAIVTKQSEKTKDPLDEKEVKTWVSTGYLFGWNGKYKGQQSGRPVILPGTVIQLPCKLNQDDITELVGYGFDLDPDDFKRGYGTICVHPGKARRKYSPSSVKPILPADSFRAKWVGNIVEISKKPLPSPSQISALREELRNKGSQKAIEYLNRQKGRINVSDDWGNCGNVIKDMLQEATSKMQQQTVIQVLELLADLAIVKQAQENK